MPKLALFLELASFYYFSGLSWEESPKNGTDWSEEIFPGSRPFLGDRFLGDYSQEHTVTKRLSWDCQAHQGQASLDALNQRFLCLSVLSFGSADI